MSIVKLLNLFFRFFFLLVLAFTQGYVPLAVLFHHFGAAVAVLAIAKGDNTFAEGGGVADFTYSDLTHANMVASVKIFRWESVLVEVDDGNRLGSDILLGFIEFAGVQTLGKGLGNAFGRMVGVLAVVTTRSQQENRQADKRKSDIILHVFKMLNTFCKDTKCFNMVSRYFC